MHRSALTLFLALTTAAACGVPSDFGNRPEDPSAQRIAALRTIILRVRDAELYRLGDVRMDAMADLGLSLYPTATGEGLPPEFLGAVLVRDPQTAEMETSFSTTGPDDGVRVRLYQRDAFGTIMLPLQLVGFMDFIPGTDAGDPIMAILAETEGLEAFELADRTYLPEQMLDWDGTMGAGGATSLAVEAGPLDAGGFGVQVVIEEATDDDATVDLTLSEEGGAIQGTLAVDTRVTLTDAAGFGLLIAEVDLGGTPGAVTVSGSADLTVTDEGGGWQFFHQIGISGPIATPTFVHQDGDPLEENHIQALESYWFELITMLDIITGAQGLPSPVR